MKAGRPAWTFHGKRVGKMRSWQTQTHNIKNMRMYIYCSDLDLFTYVRSYCIFFTVGTKVYNVTPWLHYVLTSGMQKLSFFYKQTKKSVVIAL